MNEFGVFGLTFDALHERLDRIENLLGITDLTPAQQALETLDEEGVDES